MIMNQTFCLFAWTVALAVLPASAAPTLKVGDPAPAIKVAKWIKGQAVERFDPGQIYVVEFWATWCGPCIKNIPHLTEFAKTYEGKVRIVGVSIWEARKGDAAKRLEKVEAFVTSMGDKMDYTVAADDDDGFMGKTWMDAAEQKGIPTAFIIGKDGKVAWIGYPWVMNEKLAQIVAGTPDPQAGGEEAAKKQAEDALFAATRKQVEEKNDQEALASLDKLDVEHPELAGRSACFRYQILLDFDEAAASKQARKLLEGPLKDDYAALYTITCELTEPFTRKDVDWEVAVDLGKRAVELSHGKAFALGALAHAYYRQGDLPKAIETVELAIRKGAENPDFNSKKMSIFKYNLQRYRIAAAKAAGASSITPATH